jgi:hypothetical protein
MCMCTLHMCNNWVYRAAHKSVSQFVKCAVTYLEISCILIQMVELQCTEWRIWSLYISLLIVYKNSRKWDHPWLLHYLQCCDNIFKLASISPCWHQNYDWLLSHSALSPSPTITDELSHVYLTVIYLHICRHYIYVCVCIYIYIYSELVMMKNELWNVYLIVIYIYIYV